MYSKNANYSYRVAKTERVTSIVHIYRHFKIDSSFVSRRWSFFVSFVFTVQFSCMEIPFRRQLKIFDFAKLRLAKWNSNYNWNREVYTNENFVSIRKKFYSTECLKSIKNDCLNSMINFNRRFHGAFGVCLFEFFSVWFS